MFSLAFIFAIKRAIDSDKPIKNCTGNYVNVLMQLGLIKKGLWASLVAQWLRIRLPIQGTRV